MRTKRVVACALAVFLLLAVGGCKKDPTIDNEESYIEILSVNGDIPDSLSMVVRVLHKGQPVPLSMLAPGVSITEAGYEVRTGEREGVSYSKPSVFLMIADIDMRVPVSCGTCDGRFPGYVSSKDGFRMIRDMRRSARSEYRASADPEGYWGHLADFIDGLPHDGVPALFVIYVAHAQELRPGEFQKLEEALEDHQGAWIIAFTDGCPSCVRSIVQEVGRVAMKRLLFARPLSGYDLAEQTVEIERARKQISRTDFRVAFRLDGALDPDEIDHEFVVEFRIGGQTLSDRAAHQLDEIPQPERPVPDMLAGCRDYMDWCRQAFEQTDSAEYLARATDVFHRHFAVESAAPASDKQLHEALLLADYAEVEWDAWSFPWYRDAKLMWLKERATMLESAQAPLSERIAAYDDILALDGSNTDARFYRAAHRGDIARDLGSRAEALRLYGDALAIRQESWIRSRISETVRSYLRALYSDANHSRYCDVAASYSGYVPNEFEYAYYYAESASRTGRADAALANYEWLHDNWLSDQTYIGWNTLVDRLLEAYAADLKFEDAYGFLRKTFSDESWQAPLDIHLALVYLRGQYVTPFVRAAGVCLASGGTHAMQVFEADLSRRGFPGDDARHISAIYTLSPSGAVDHILWGSAEKVVLPDRVPSRARGAFVAGDGNYWFVQPIPQGQLVLQMSGWLTREVDLVLSNVAGSPTKPELWRQLETVVHESGRRIAVELLAPVMSAEMAVGTPDVESRYDDIFKSIPASTYAAIQDADGNLVHVFDFQRESVSYESGDWSMTSQARLFYVVDVVLGGDRHTEVGSALHEKKERTGVLRIGLRKI